MMGSWAHGGQLGAGLSPIDETDDRTMNRVNALLEAARQLCERVESIRPRLIHESPLIEWAYNPLDYAWALHSAYIQRHGGGGAKTLLVGMNPGRGMGNTGVPFGCPVMVREVLGIVGLPVVGPSKTHPKRPILGLNDPEPETSGTRIWSELKRAFGAGNAAGAHVYIVNHCPLWMFSGDGCNITPDNLSKKEDAVIDLMQVCDEHLLTVAAILDAKRIIGVGRYAQHRCVSLFKSPPFRIDYVPHPSPRNRKANENGGADWRAAFRIALDLDPENGRP